MDLLPALYSKLASLFLLIGPDYLFAAVLIFTWTGITLGDYGRKLRRAELTLSGVVLATAALSISCVALLVEMSVGGVPRFYTVAFFAWAILALPVSVAAAIWHLKTSRPNVQP